MKAGASVRGAVCVLALAAVSGALSAQQPPLLRASVDQVVVDVVVTDETGVPVTGLIAADFEVSEDGRPQSIATFSEVALPLVARAPDVVTALVPAGEVRSNRQSGAGRVYLLVLDDLHVGVTRSAVVRREARGFIRRYVQPGDVVAVVQTGGGGYGQDFTADMALVEAAIERFSGHKDPSPTLQRIEGRLPAPRLSPDDEGRLIPGRPVTTEDQLRIGTNALQTIVKAAAVLEATPGRRKAMLYFSEGIVIPPETREGQELVKVLDRTWAAAARANITIYAIDPRGLTQQGEELLAMRRPPTPDQRMALERERSAGADLLRSLAEGTGGVAAVQTNDLGRTLARVASDSSHYYLLGYVPTDTRRDGRYRTLSVRVTRPGLQISARKGYTAPSNATPSRKGGTITDASISPELRALLSRAVPEAGLTFAAVPVVLPGADRNVRIVIEVAPGALPAAAPADARENPLELAIVAVDRSGRTFPVRKGRTTIAPGDAAAVSKDGLRVIEEMTLPAGHYQLRIAMREQRGGTSGVVICDLEVPAPEARGLTMSGLVLGAASAARVPSLNIDRRLTAGLGGALPTTVRTFAPGDVVSAFVELTVGSSPGASISVTATIRDAQGVVVLTRTSVAVAKGRQPARETLKLPLENVPGRYLLRFEARIGRHAPVAREVWFDIGAPAG